MTTARVKKSVPVRDWYGPGRGAEEGVPKCRRRAFAKVSKTRELLPDPLTPVTQVNAPKGIEKSTFLRL